MKTSWYDSIKEVTINKDEVQITTNLFKKDSNKSIAQTIANAILFSDTVSIKTVNVSAGDDDPYFFTKRK